MNKIILLAFSTLFLFVACNFRAGNEQSLTVISEKDVAVNDTLIQNIIDTLSIIPLEETPECLLGNIKKVQKANNEFFVMAEGSNRLSAIYRFSSDGKFLNRIGRLGNARNEYLKIGSFFVLNEKVYIADLNKNKILIYNIDGEFIDSNESNENIKFLHDMQAIDNDMALFSYNINFSDNDALFEVVDLNSFKVLKTITTTYKADGSFPYSLKEFAYDGENILLSLPFDNNVYKMNKRNFTIEKVMSLGLWGDIPSFNTNDFEEMQETMEEAGTSLLYGLFVSGNKILLNSIQGSILWHKDSGKGLYLENEIDLNKMKRFPFLPLSVCYSDIEGFYSVFSADSFTSIVQEKELEKKEGVRPQTTINTISDNKNPVIVKYILKSL